MVKRLIVFIAIVIGVSLWSLWPATARAQGPESIDFDLSLDDYESEFTLLTWTEFLAEWPPTYGGCTPIDPWTGNPSDLGTWRDGIGWSTITCGVQQYDATPSFGQHFIIGLKTNFFVYSPDTTADFYITYRTPTANSELSDFVFCYDDGAYEAITKIGQIGNQAHYEIEAGQSCQIVVAKRFVDFGEDPYSAVTRFTTDYYNPAQDCPTVQNANFVTADGWLLTNGASITTSILSLPVDGVAAQNLTLTSNRTYNAVISTTATVSDTTNLTVRLGTQSQSQEISAAGEYTFTFTTATLGGPIAYIIENTGPAAIDIDFTCVSLFTSPGGQGECLQPTNGTFETADNWTYYRNASWFSPAKKANLPHADAGLIESTPVFTFPSIGTGEFLLLGFTAQSEGSGAYVGNRGLGGPGAIVVTSTYQVYPQEYQYEIDYTDLASATSGSISFVNPGSTGYEGVTSTADFKVDNVCVFISNRPPNLPTPLDPDGISPIDLGFNYTSCDDVDGLLAGFGVNIQQYRAEYEAGPSLWDPIGWVPWLVAAIWNALALYLCVFMAAYVTLVDILEYLINNFLNIASWLIRSWPAFVQWLLSVWAWLLATLPNVLAWLGDTIVLGLTWFFLSGGNLFVFTAFMLGYFIQAALDYLNWLGFDLPDNLLDLLLNGLIGIANLFITAWNLFVPAVEFVIGGIINVFVGLWNLLAPFLSAVWSYVTGGSLPLLLLNPMVYLVLAVFNLVWMLILWIWANVFMVVNIPIQFYYAFDTGVKGEAFASLIACASENFWCQMLAGVQLVNQTSAHSIGYPIVIVGIIVGSLVIFWEYIWALFHTEIS